MKHILVLLVFLVAISGHSQDNKVYHWHPKKDAVIMISSGLLWGGSEFLKATSPIPTNDDILDLDMVGLWSLDRNAVYNVSERSAQWSDNLLYASAALPFLQLAGKRAREQTGVLMAMTLEAYLLNDGVTNFLKATTSRFRPYTYNPDIPVEDKLTSNARYSFASGHTSNVAMLSFFSAKVFHDLYPESKWRPVVWAGAITVPALTGYLRTKAGRHFPTDVMTGYVIGAAVGVLIPHLHKISTHDHDITISAGPYGMMLTYNRTLN